MVSLPAGALPEGLTITVTGAVLYADAGRGVFGSILPDGTFTELPGAARGPRRATDVGQGLGRPGDLVVDCGSFLLRPAHELRSSDVGRTGLAAAWRRHVDGEGLTLGARRAVLVADVGRPGRVRQTTGDIPALTIYPAPVGWGVTSGPDGNVWFTAPGSDSVGRMTPSGGVSLFPLPTSTRGPATSSPVPTATCGSPSGGRSDRSDQSVDGRGNRVPATRGDPFRQSIIAGRGGLLWFTAQRRGSSPPTPSDTSAPASTPRPRRSRWTLRPTAPSFASARRLPSPTPA